MIDANNKNTELCFFLCFIRKNHILNNLILHNIGIFSISMFD